MNWTYEEKPIEKPILKQIKNLSKEIYAEFGNPNAAEWIKSILVSLQAYRCWRRRNKPIIAAPKTVINRYRFSQQS